ncbi:MAG: aldolase/citrate lyase family protein [Eubacteriales bacterium]|nr:aldolase/citrate lyase family protein [Eubacteriales bacterium]
MTLKEKLKKGPVFGMTCYTGAICVIETIARSGLDFIYLDLEHSNWSFDADFEKQIMACKGKDISILVRVPDVEPVTIRKVLEWGADGVVIPHCKTAEMARAAVDAAKFNPMGHRGGESNVRAANYGYENFDWNEYMAQQNRDTMVIPMDEDWEFTENIDEILDVPGIDAINFGPVDYAVSKGLPVGYSMSPEVHDAFKVLVEKAQKKGIGVLGPVVPPTAENMRRGIEDGFNMIIVGNDMWHFTTSMKDMMKNHVNVLREELCK